MKIVNRKLRPERVKRTNCHDIDAGTWERQGASVVLTTELANPDRSYFPSDTDRIWIVSESYQDAAGSLFKVRQRPVCRRGARLFPLRFLPHTLTCLSLVSPLFLQSSSRIPDVLSDEEKTEIAHVNQTFVFPESTASQQTQNIFITLIQC